MDRGPVKSSWQLLHIRVIDILKYIVIMVLYGNMQHAIEK